MTDRRYGNHLNWNAIVATVQGSRIRPQGFCDRVSNWGLVLDRDRPVQPMDSRTPDGVGLKFPKPFPFRPNLSHFHRAMCRI